METGWADREEEDEGQTKESHGVKHSGKRKVNAHDEQCKFQHKLIRSN
jgi:hypothetical protein